MNKLVIIILAFVLTQTTSNSQELLCEVSVLSPKAQEENVAVYDILKSSIEEFMNSRKWTDDDYEFYERIECNIQITIKNAISQTQFDASIQIQSSRPVYNSDYKTPVFIANDNDFSFSFQPNTLIQFSTDQHRDNLSSVLGFYAYYILGMDYDSYSPLGGTDNFLKAQQVVSNCQNAGESGWRPSENKRNRYWLVENILSQTFAPLRDINYTYHRQGFDLMYSSADAIRTRIVDDLNTLRSIHQIKPTSYNMQLFFIAKSDEILNIYRDSSEDEKRRVRDLLMVIDPGNISKYERLR
tara:strand:+ start:10762 stop:11655 length:894 start_codon:yes stop_codon:yes gene_type:complete